MSQLPTGERLTIWVLIAFISLLVVAFFSYSIKAKWDDKEFEMFSGLETFVYTKVTSIEQSFENVATKGYTRQQFNDYLTSFIVPITSAKTSDTTKLRSILITRTHTEKDPVCNILTPGAEVGAKVIPCNNIVLNETFTNNEFFNRSRLLPRSKTPAMYLTRLISVPHHPLFHDTDYMLLADWARDEWDKDTTNWTMFQLFYGFIALTFVLAVGFKIDRRLQKANYNKRLLDNLFKYCSTGLIVAKETPDPTDGGIIVLANDAMNKLAGGRHLVNSRIRDIMPDRYVEKHNDGFAEVNKGKDSDVVNDINREMLYLLTKAGDEIPVNIILGKFMQDGEMLHIASVSDLTTIVAQVEEIKQLEKEKENLLKMFMAAQKKLIQASKTNTEIIKRRTSGNKVLSGSAPDE